jgi:spermidine synthase
VAEWLFLAAYTSSGLAGLVYEVTWTRLLTLSIGHTTAAASTVVAAFMGGLAIGAAVGGRLAPRLTRTQALYAYAALELVTVLTALTMPFGLEALTRLLTLAYRDGAPGMLFPAVRLLASAALLTIPAIALGATFPTAVRWFVDDPEHPGSAGGRLYAANTTGAAIGALAAGFLMIPAIGLSGTTYVGVTASLLSIAIVLLLARRPDAETAPGVAAGRAPQDVGRTSKVRRDAGPKRPGLQDLEKRAKRKPAIATLKGSRHSPAGATVKAPPGRDPRWLAAVVLALTGLATFMYEIAWTRVFSMIIGPSTYAFAATLTAFIGGLACGSFVGAAVAARTRRPALALTFALTAAAAAATGASVAVGGPLPREVALQLAAGRAYSDLLLRHSMLVAALMAPTAVALGIAFPLALDLAGDRDQPAARSLGGVYAVNTVAAVAGSLLAGFVAIPLVGLQQTVGIATLLLIAGAVTVAIRGTLATFPRGAALVAAASVAWLSLTSAGWDRELLASGAYKYARRVPQGVDVPAALKAGTLLYYREGATGTVSVKRLTGELSLAIDGKVDASTSGDMLTQKTLAHLPLLLHENPREVLIIGLGSGVTLASALVHPAASVDVVEISPEVVDASAYFAAENHDALQDPRTRLIVGDGRSHLSLSSKKYDVIVSEPSNPWMAGVAALFTREFFAAARDRLAPGGVICQWAHTYDISPDDLRSVVATFASVFPHGTMWLVGDGDLLLVGSVDPLEARLENIEAAWTRPGVAADLGAVSVREPFALLSLFVGGPNEIRRYSEGATLQTDDRLALEFSGPRALNSPAAEENVSALRQLLAPDERPSAIARAYAAASARQWRDRAEMLQNADAYAAAYRDYATALRIDPSDSSTTTGLVRTAIAANQQGDADGALKAAISARPNVPAPRIALSKLLAASGAFDEAVAVAQEASALTPPDPAALEQLASLYSDAGDAVRLDVVVNRLQPWAHERAGPHYYAAGSKFLQGRFDEALAGARHAVALDPRYAAAHNLLGAIHASLGQAEAAREAFRAALSLDPRDSATYTNLGLLELSAGNRRTAADLFAEALSLDPASLAARRGLGQADPNP